MEEHDIVSFVKGNIEPLDRPIASLSPSFRCAAYLKDGRYIPCLVITSLLAYKAEERARQETRALMRSPRRPRSWLRRILFGKGPGTSDVGDEPVEQEPLVAAGDIARLETSRHALPVACLAKISGETSMGSTEFAVRMSDGERFYFETPWEMDFFDMPPGYSGQDAVSAAAHRNLAGPVYRPLPFLICPVDGL